MGKSTLVQHECLALREVRLQELAVLPARPCFAPAAAVQNELCKLCAPGVWQGVIHVLFKSAPRMEDVVEDAFVKLLASALNYTPPHGATPGSTPALRARQPRPVMLCLGGSQGMLCVCALLWGFALPVCRPQLVSPARRA